MFHAEIIVIMFNVRYVTVDSYISLDPNGSSFKLKVSTYPLLGLMSFLFWYILIQKIVDSSTFAVDTKQSHKVYLHDLATCLTGWEW